ncbi:uncharacterized protein LOC131854436 [Achroia grisella]|uniref:uncharacterized protein LOC131854436 n=1 Tax=Achroia grisella TaxID=688607 RepID=UPI0027D27B29|nr:uncharacterized protein LOC131854436 [Achroia grisella]
MELMSSLLLCVLALLPQTLGKSGPGIPVKTQDVNLNTALTIKQMPTLRKHLHPNKDRSYISKNIRDIQSVFSDITCKTCHMCMERAIKTHMGKTHIESQRTKVEDLQYDMLTNEINGVRSKRSVNSTEYSKKYIKNENKGKYKKNRTHKYITVTKYDINDEVYALKVKEINTQLITERQSDTMISETCQIYSVKKSFLCDSREGDTFLTAAKRKANKKKPRKVVDKNKSSTTTQKAKLATLVFKKREVDNSQIPENFMPSVEDLY